MSKVATGLAALQQRAVSTVGTPRVRIGVTIVAAVAVAACTLASGLAARFHSLSGLIDSPFRGLWIFILVLGTFASVWGPGFLVASFVRPTIAGPAVRPAIAILAGSVIGWLVLCVWFVSIRAGLVVSVALLGATLVGLVFRPRAFARNDVALPLVVAVLVSALYLYLAGDHGALDQGSIAIAHRYWVSVDSVIPKIFADGLLRGRETLVNDFIVGVQSSERPPLQVGIIMPFYALSASANRAIAYLLLGIVANSIWVVALWGFLRSFALGERRILVVVVSVALVGPVFLNTIYTWPKMLAASLVLVAATFVLDRRMPGWLAAIGTASSATLALLAHGAAGFGLIGLVPLVIPVLTRWRVKGVLLGAMSFVVLYTPWFAYQRFFDPPGERLVKWHIAGVVPPNSTPALQQIAISYEHAGIRGVLENKLTNVEAIFGLPPAWGKLITGHSQVNWTDSLSGFIRQLQSSSMVPALGVLTAGLLITLIIRSARQQAWVKPTAWVIVASTVAFAVVEFGGRFSGPESPPTAAWLHHGPYSLLLLLCAAGALGITALPKPWSAAVLTLHGLFFTAIWVHGLTTQSAFTDSGALPRDPVLTICACLVATILAALVVVAPRSPAQPRVFDEKRHGIEATSRPAAVP